MAAGIAIASLAACGGGGGSSNGGGTTAPAYPASGNYAWVLKAEGPTTALKFALSLLHPSTPSVEYAIEFGSSVVTDARLLSSGSVNAGSMSAGGLQAYALVYIVGGDVRRVPLTANGQAPANQVQRAQSTTACSFLVDGVDYATPENSRYIVTTAGADGQCGTSDDGTAEVRLGAGGISLSALGGAAPLGLLRDASTMAPRGWIGARAVQLWTGTTATTRGASDPAYLAVVAAANRMALVDDGNKLSLLDLPGSGIPAETPLDATLTAGGGWATAGYDANNFYVYRNAGSGATAAWKLLAIARAAPAAKVLASGGGQVSIASMGTNFIYATVNGVAANQLLAIGKSGAVQTIASTPTSTLTTVQASAGTVHEMWQITNVGLTSITYTIKMIDESGNTLYTTSAGGYPISLVEAASVNLNASESRTQFLLADGYGALGYSGAKLVGYDATAKAATTLGTLPGNAAFGNNLVFASAMGGPGSYLGGFAAPQASGTVQTTGARVFGFTLGSAGSLTDTSTTR